MRESVLRVVGDKLDKIHATQSSIENDLESTRQEQHEIRLSMASMTHSQAEISNSLKTLTELQGVLIKKLLPLTIGMVFVLALLFAGVKFYEISNVIRPHNKTMEGEMAEINKNFLSDEK